MKMMFYQELLSEMEYTPNEKIIYSFLIYKSITLIDCAFTSDGTELDYNEIVNTLEWDNVVTMYSISQRKLANALGIANKSVFNALKTLDYYSDINLKQSLIKIQPKIIKGKFFPLLLESGLKGELLIFYSYLKHKSEYFGGTIDTFKYKLAEEFHTTKIAVTNMLNRLYRKGFAERLENGKLKIN
jgi:Mn-dependent DtxR family transcriptional regulator|nr:MAG TPA: hypothetical protein [Caudoviricetes sp.]